MQHSELLSMAKFYSRAWVVLKVACSTIVASGIMARSLTSGTMVPAFFLPKPAYRQWICLQIMVSSPESEHSFCL